MSSQNEIRQRITNQIIAALEGNALPMWRKPWRSDPHAGFPCNIVSRSPYSGVNPLLLEIAAQRHGLQSRYWATFRQWEALGGRVNRRPEHVPPGHWGTQIVFCRPVTKKDTGESGEEGEEKFALPQFYGTAFHELTHWTEHPSRLNWNRSKPENSYALGELIAELGGVYLAGELGLPTSQNLSNHAAYLKHWLGGMRNDSRF